MGSVHLYSMSGWRLQGGLGHGECKANKVRIMQVQHYSCC